MQRLTRLFEPIQIKDMWLKNRIVMPAMATNYCTEFGFVNDRVIDFYVERAKNGVSLIVIENTCIDWPEGKVGPSPIRADTAVSVKGLHELAEAVHYYDVKLATNLQHAGRQASLISTEGKGVVSASEIPGAHAAIPKEIPRKLTIDQIREIEAKFAEAALRTKNAGFDAAEIHGAHGYLITQFMSPFTNKRTDLYGGTFENRMRFPLEIVEQTREMVGDDFPLIFRMSGDEFVEGGLTLEDNRKIAKMLECVGVDILSVSAGIYESEQWIFPVMGMPDGCLVYLAEGIKKAVSIPVIAVGKLGNLVLAEEILKQGKADLVALGRSLFADPELPRKAMEGRFEDVRPCIYCNEGCIGSLFKGWAATCDVNPTLGKEGRIDCQIRPADKLKQVIIVGGGPAGMEAARVAASRGHKVTLYEKNNELGGQLLLASVPSWKTQEITSLKNYLEIQVKKLGVRIELGFEVSVEHILKLGPDVVIIATGAMPSIPEIRGVDLAKVVTANDILAGKRETDGKVVVLGGGRIGCETALFLAMAKKEVTIVSRHEEPAFDMNPINRHWLLKKVENAGVKIILNTNTQEITDEGVIIADQRWQEKTITADTIVLARGSKPNRGLIENLSDKVPELYAIGDCVKPRTIREAIHTAYNVGLSI